MRIVGGQFRGRSIKAPKGTDTRPTGDRVREATFSRLEALEGSLADMGVLDAYAGSGALGLEALSRGARATTFVDKGRKALETLRGNVSTLGVEGDSRVVSGDVRALAARGAIPGAPFALLFLDPPYRIDESEVSAVVGDFVEHGTLADDALVVWEHAAETDPDLGPLFEDLGRKVYGSTHVSWYRLTRGGRG